MSKVLVINSGSSSFKYQIIDPTSREVYAKGLVEKIGNGQGSSGTIVHKSGDASWAENRRIPDYRAGFDLMMEAFDRVGPHFTEEDIAVVGHRVVHGGQRYSGPTLIDERVEKEIDQLSILAPLHNPPALECIRVAREFFPTPAHVAIFDTAFHHSVAPEYAHYAIPEKYATEFGIRRYGFHGTSHEYVGKRAAKMLGKPFEEVNLITLHLGNGASATAIKNGQSFNTSMGMTPLEGLVMGTRSGDIDPGVLYFLHKNFGYTPEEIDRLLNKESGLFGMTGHADMREVQELAAQNDAAALRALAKYYGRVKHYIGGFFASLGRVDGIVFTAGVGENSVETRAGILSHLEHLGIVLDQEKNALPNGEERIISREDSAIPVFVIPTNEELEIAKQVYGFRRS